jgi:ribosome-binding protein aMBF1 (putative translation factor)
MLSDARMDRIDEERRVFDLERPSGSPGPRRRGTPPELEDVETRIGRAIRRRRRMLDLTLQQLGDRCGVSFQQVQKYESAVNTISAAQLFALSRALEVPVSYFFESLERE